MAVEQTYARILDLFNKVRIDKDADFDSQYFMAYLTKDPNDWGKTFLAQRQKITFLRTIETDFHICFPLEVYERNWSLENFAQYVDARMTKHQVNLKMAEKQMASAKQHPTNALIFAFLMIIALCKLVVSFLNFSDPTLASTILTGICCFGLAALYGYFHRKECTYYQRLQTLITAQMG